MHPLLLLASPRFQNKEDPSQLLKRTSQAQTFHLWENWILLDRLPGSCKTNHGKQGAAVLVPVGAPAMHPPHQVQPPPSPARIESSMTSPHYPRRNKASPRSKKSVPETHSIGANEWKRFDVWPFRREASDVATLLSLAMAMNTVTDTHPSMPINSDKHIVF